MATTIPNRPFSTDLITGLMLPDGIFVTMLGQQNINVQIDHAGPGTLTGPKLYIESVSNPGIAYTAGTRYLPDLSPGAVRVEQWQADFSHCPSGTHLISFIIEDSAGTKTRIIKKIFVMGLTFDAASHTFNAETPEGMLAVNFIDLVSPKKGCRDNGQKRCCWPPYEKRDPRPADAIADDTDDRRLRGIKKDAFTFTNLTEMFERLGPDFTFCPPGYLPHRMKMVWTPTPPYAGQYSDLPFQDPWWKILLCIIAVLLLIAASIAEAVDGSGSVTVSGGGGGGSGTGSCCGVSASGSGTSPIAAGLVAAAAAVATAAGCSDIRDPMRRGQDATPPGAGELTQAELLQVELTYPDAVAPGRPFAVAAQWSYERVTNANTYPASANDLTQNIHLASSYEIDAPDVVATHVRDGEWIIRARFRDQDQKLFRGGQLLVQCFLTGPQGQLRRLLLQDDGTVPDAKPGDGIYGGRHHFSQSEAGLWHYFVIAQDVNHATPDMAPEEAAQIIGGMLLTHQLTITFDQDNCPLVPDGYVNVV